MLAAPFRRTSLQGAGTEPRPGLRGAGRQPRRETPLPPPAAGESPRNPAGLAGGATEKRPSERPRGDPEVSPRGAAVSSGSSCSASGRHSCDRAREPLEGRGEEGCFSDVVAVTAVENGTDSGEYVPPCPSQPSQDSASVFESYKCDCENSGLQIPKCV